MPEQLLWLIALMTAHSPERWPHSAFTFAHLIRISRSNEVRHSEKHSPLSQAGQALQDNWQRCWLDKACDGLYTSQAPYVTSTTAVSVHH